MEGDGLKSYGSRPQGNFNPLPPYGGRRKKKHSGRWCKHFNPLPPYGGRLSDTIDWDGDETFQSTPSVWRETTQYCTKSQILRYFNPLPPYGGRRRCRRSLPGFRTYFNPLPPYGGRLCLQATPRPCQAFQSTPSVWRETLMSVQKL